MQRETEIDPSSTAFSKATAAAKSVLRSPVEMAIMAAILLLLGFEFVQIFHREVNWDEFFYLSHIYLFNAGQLGKALQAFQVYLLFWIPLTGGNEINQIEVGRVIMWILHVFTCIAIFAVSRRFFSFLHSLIAVLALLCTAFVLDHGASFRADPIAAALLMGTIAILLLSRLHVVWLGIAAVLMAIAALITVKSGLYAGAIASAALWRVVQSDSPRRTFWMLLGCGIATGCLFATGYMANLLALPNATHDGSGVMMSSAAGSMFGDVGFFPRLDDFLRLLVFSPATMLFLLGGLCIVIRDAFRGQRTALLLLGLASPLLTLLFYRNAFPYYYAFILPPAMMLVARTMSAIDGRRWTLILVVAAMLVPAVRYSVGQLHKVQIVQQETIEAVHRIFPSPVAYIDRNSMVASFPKRGPFMSTWGLKSYVEKQQPVFAGILRTETVPLLIVNSPSIEAALGLPVSSQLHYRLLPADEAALRDNYAHYWGAIWIAGKDVALGAGCTAVDIAIPGTYVLHSTDPISVNGSVPTASNEFAFARGEHKLCTERAQKLMLRWAVQAPKPRRAPTSGPIYQGF